MSWRQACAAEISKLRTIYDQYHDQGFEIIGFACDYRREDAEKFLHENEMPWATVYGEKGPSPTFELYGIMTFPTGILIGKDGSVIALNVRRRRTGQTIGKTPRAGEVGCVKRTEQRRFMVRFMHPASSCFVNAIGGKTAHKL